MAGEKGRNGRAAPAERTVERASAPVTPFPTPKEHRAPRPVAAAASRGGRGRGGGQQRGEDVVVGLGDLVPAFLMTPVRRAK